MSTTTAPADALRETDAETPAPPGPLTPLLATVIALAAAVLALMDASANGLGPATVHLVFVLAVFTVVRISVGLALAPCRPAPPDDPEST
ncbi:hypothetical protein [Streptomyces qinglanensis]|uniref:hypothetical protein n=1 Tax=Streptomyces qinglanensis TaxID=943816 RepID=UPI003D733B05